MPRVRVTSEHKEQARRLGDGLRQVAQRRASRKLRQPILRKVRIHAFRNLIHEEIELDQLNLIIGENNSGKTNLLTAISFLAPLSLEREVKRFQESFGDLGMGSLAESFLNHLGTDAFVAGRSCERKEFGFRASGSWRDFRAEWIRAPQDSLSLLYGTSNLSPIRWLRPPYGALSGRRFARKPGVKTVAENERIGTELQHELLGSTRISLSLNPSTEGSGLDRLEQEIPELIQSGALHVKQWLNAAEKILGITGLRYSPTRGINMIIFPSPRQAARMDERRHHQADLVRLLEVHAAELGEPGGSALARARDDLAQLTEHRESFLGGGLAWGERSRPAKELGSGHRRVLMLTAQILSSDFCLIDEPELFLHPSTLERLLDFIVESSSRTQIVLASHSGVVINHLRRHSSARIYRLAIPSEGESRQLYDIATQEVRDVVDRLGFRSAHILQANAILWVEGPTDELYLSKWIELYEASESRSGLRLAEDFVFVSYGGSLVSHLAEGGDDSVMWALNSRAIFIADSDKRSAASPLKPTVSAVVDAVRRRGGYAFTTDGREIENYLPPRIFSASAEQVATWQYLDVYRTFARPGQSKVDFARNAVAKLTVDDLDEMEDLRGHLAAISDLLLAWTRARPLNDQPGW